MNNEKFFKGEIVLWSLKLLTLTLLTGHALRDFFVSSVVKCGLSTHPDLDLLVSATLPREFAGWQNGAN